MKGGINIVVKNSDVKLDGSSTIIEGFDIIANVCDFKLDHPDRRRKDIQTSDYRRALVHDLQDGLTLNWAEDYPGGVTIQGNVHIPKTLEAGNLEGKSLLVVEGGYVGGPLSISGKIETRDEIIGRASLLLFSKGSVPFGWYSAPQLSIQLEKCGFDPQTIQMFVARAMGSPQMIYPEIDQKYITLTDEKISIVSYHPITTNPAAGTPGAAMGMIGLVPQVVSSVDLLRFDIKDNLVETPNLKVDGTIKAGPEQLDLVSEINALKQQVAELKAKVDGRH